MRQFTVLINWIDRDGPRFWVIFEGQAAGPQFENREFSFMTEAFEYAQQSMIEALQGMRPEDPRQ